MLLQRPTFNGTFQGYRSRSQTNRTVHICTHAVRQRQTVASVSKPARPSQAVPALAKSTLLGFAGALLACTLTVAPAALADIQTVPPDQALSQAKPLQPQKVDKRKVWFIFVMGAAALFGSTVVLENNESFFPAISRANRAMSAARRQQQRDESLEEAYLRALEEGQGVGTGPSAAPVQQLQDPAAQAVAAAQSSNQATMQEGTDDVRLAAAVQAGLTDAKQRVGMQQDSSPIAAPQSQDSPSIAAAAAASAAPQTAPATAHAPVEERRPMPAAEPTTSFPSTLSAADAVTPVGVGDAGLNSSSATGGYVVVSQDSELQGSVVQQV